jgi:glycosyltransferase involved in cell wall biosynthesis
MPQPRVAILLCTFNGAAFLEQQLASFAAQTVQDFIVLASDDGSTDATLAMLENARTGFLAGRLRILDGPRTGVNDNFLSFFRQEAPPAAFMAYADQDDIWDADKLERALRWLETTDPIRPALYGTRTRLIDRHGKEIGMTQHYRRAPSFQNALVQSMFGGNTMAFNAATWKLLHMHRPANVVAHDWWTYIAVTAVNGSVRYDAEPSLSYRQHESNLVGARATLQTRFRSFRAGRFAKWNAINAAAVASLWSDMPVETRAIFKSWQEARAAKPPRNGIWLRRSGVYRQTLAGDTALWLATLTGRL